MFRGLIVHKNHYRSDAVCTWTLGAAESRVMLVAEGDLENFPG